MAKLKPWYQVVFPREDLREGKPMDASEFAVHLDHVRSFFKNKCCTWVGVVGFVVLQCKQVGGQCL